MQVPHLPEQRLLGAGRLRGTVLEVVVAVGAEAGKGTHILCKIHLAILVGVQNAHEFIVVTLPELRLWWGLGGVEGSLRAGRLTHTLLPSPLLLRDPTHPNPHLFWGPISPSLP